MAEQKRVENSLQLFDSFPRLLPVPADIPARKLLPSPFLHSRSSREEECLSNDGLARGKPSSRAICKNRSIPFVSSPCFCAPTNRTRSNLAGEGGGGRVELGLKRVPCRRILVSIYRCRYVLNGDARRRSYESLMDERGMGWVRRIPRRIRS